MLDCSMLVVLQFGFVLDDLTIKFVDQCVDGCIEVHANTFNMDVLAAQAQIDLGFLSLFFLGELINGQDDRDINDMIEMAFDPLKLVRDVFTDGWR